MTAAMNIQEIAWGFDAEFCKKNIGHVPVEVLTGMNENLFERLVLTQCARERKRFNELRPCADDGHYPPRTTARRGICMMLPQSVFPDQIRSQPDLDKFSEDLKVRLDMECAVIGLEGAHAGPGREMLHQARLPAQSCRINR